MGALNLGPTMSIQPRSLPVAGLALALALAACTSKTDPVDGADSAAPGGEWEELDGDDGDDGDDKADSGADGGDGTKDEEWPVCGDEVVEGEACEGTWEETVCVDEDGVFWWCDDGVWTADKD